jgi:two-component sensor histidine kinase
LNHRVKNTLAVVQGMARQTFRDHATHAHLETFEDRLAALSRAHNLLTDSNWASARLRDVVRDQIGVERWGDRFSMEGPIVPLSPQIAVNLALVLHELCTNATKYGALSNDKGRVAISWTLSPDSRALRLRWAETGGPPVAVPERRGFGSRMIERALAAEPGGRVTLHYLPSGVVCELEAPVAGFPGE